MAAGHPLLMVGGGVEPFWHAAVGVPTATALYCSAAGNNGIFIARNWGNTVLRTVDAGVNWINDSGGNKTWISGAYGNPGGTPTFVFLADDGTTEYSTDNGDTWNAGDTGLGAGSQIRWCPSGSGGGFYLATRNTTDYATSANGIGWSTTTFPSGNTFISIADSQAQGVIVCGQSVAGTPSGSFITKSSNGGASWALKTTPTPDQALTEISASPTKFYCPNGLDGLYSDDGGETWTRVTQSELGSVQQPITAYASGYFIGATNSNLIHAPATVGKLTFVTQIAGSNTTSASAETNRYYITTTSSPYVYLGHYS
jgi:hypothetical protein